MPPTNYKKLKKQFIESVATKLCYIIDQEIKEQWKTAKVFAEIIWDDNVESLLKIKEKLK